MDCHCFHSELFEDYISFLVCTLHGAQFSTALSVTHSKDEVDYFPGAQNCPGSRSLLLMMAAENELRKGSSAEPTRAASAYAEHQGNDSNHCPSLSPLPASALYIPENLYPSS